MRDASLCPPCIDRCHRSMQGIGRPADRPIDHPCAPSLRGGHTQPFVRQRQSRLRRETSTASVHPTPSREVARGIDRETACHADSRRLTPTHADSRRLSSRAARPRCSRLLASSADAPPSAPRPLLDPSSTPPRPLLAPARVPSGQVPGRAPSVRSRSAACWLRDPEPFRDPVPTRHEPPRASIPRPNPHIADRAPHAHA